MNKVRDKEGFVINYQDWNRSLANTIAAEEGIRLDEAHWQIISLVREFYEEFDLSPVNRTLVNYVKTRLGEEKGNSMYLLKLFPGSPAKLCAKIAGLPKPANCL
ncbi:MAG: sulfurtransferase TusE [Proteobacteria bacterium]|nr:MAG: sulfurtransferase TusE [Pseudomonadota bacterium]PIE40346.1 MAG: sulfurtransferase TusE [Gammaproteobacteria bacterium]